MSTEALVPENPRDTVHFDAVLLVHGTFAFLSKEKETTAQPIPWWSRQSEFCERLNDRLKDIAGCWPPIVCPEFPWSKPRPGRLAAYYNRITFSWSGRNSEADRREAGSRLLEGLRRLEADGQPSYHLIGHSYGGAVIWHALLEDERRSRVDANYTTLRKLKSWTTLGTPFPKYRSKRMTWLAWVTLLAVAVLPTMLVVASLSLPWKTWLWLPGSLSVGTWVLIGLLVALGLMLGWGRLAAWRWARRAVALDLERDVWKRYGHSWLGLFTPTLDEAIVGLRRAINPYIPIPSLRLGIWGIPIDWGLIPMFELPVNSYVRTRAQGPEAGSLLAAIDTEPVLHAKARGPMPDELEKDLRAVVGDKSRLAVSLNSDALVSESRDSKPVAELLRSLSAEIQLDLGLFHTSYYESPKLQEAIALHIRRHSTKDEHDDPQAAFPTSLNPKTLEWLRLQPEDSLEPGATPDPPDTIPLRARLPHAIAVCALACLCLYSVRDDFNLRYLPALLDRVTMELGPVRDDAFDLLYGIARPGRTLLIGELVFLFPRGDTGEKLSERAHATSTYIYDRIKAKGPEVLPTLLEQLDALAPSSGKQPGQRLAILSLIADLAETQNLGPEKERERVKCYLDRLLVSSDADSSERRYAKEALESLAISIALPVGGDSKRGGK
jgi:pimeloyl-ACP methyl ester carboxylesterase